MLVDFTFTAENRNSNPLRQQALASFIGFIDADDNKMITPEEAAIWLAAHPDLDSAIVDGDLNRQDARDVSARAGNLRQ